MILGNRTTNPGELRTPITLQVATFVEDSGGARKQAWSNFVSNPNVYAKWVNAHGPETAAQAEISIQRATVTIRYRSDVNNATAILKGSERWQVKSIDNIQNRNEYLELQVELVKGTL